jgi:hypothetical protein
MAVRVLLIVSKTNSFWTQSWSSTEETLVAALSALKKSQLVKYQDDIEVPLRILAKEKWDSKVFIVFDIFNFGYDPALGHLLEHNSLPVLVVQFSGKGEHTRIAEVGLRRRVNREICEVHNRNGIGGTPPYVVDHTAAVPIYMNPRDPSLLQYASLNHK